MTFITLLLSLFLSHYHHQKPRPYHHHQKPQPRQVVVRPQTRSVSRPAYHAGGIAACVRRLENSGSYTDSRPDADGVHHGAYQFDDQTWAAAGGTGSAANASPAEQDRRFTYWYSQHPSAWAQTAPRC